MAKAAIRKLKDERFWRWLMVEVYGKPAPKQPIKRNRKRTKFRKRRLNQLCDRGWITVQAKLEEWRNRGAAAVSKSHGLAPAPGADAGGSGVGK